MAAFLNALWWRASRHAAAIGLPGIVALLLFAGAVVLWFTVDRPAAEQARQLLAENERLEAEWRVRPAALGQAPARAESPLRQFQARLPDERRITAELGRFHALAIRHGLVLERGEFKITSAANDPVSQYAMVMPVTADYRTLRKFIREVLRSQPALALEEISLRRDDPASPVVDARLRFVLFVTAPG